MLPLGYLAFLHCLDLRICGGIVKKKATKTARAEIFERQHGKTTGFGIVLIGPEGSVSSGQFHRTKAYAEELARVCGAADVTDIGPPPLPE